MLHRKLSKWIYTVSNNCIKFPRTFFFTKFSYSLQKESQLITLNSPQRYMVPQF